MCQYVNTLAQCSFTVKNFKVFLIYTLLLDLRYFFLSSTSLYFSSHLLTTMIFSSAIICCLLFFSPLFLLPLRPKTPFPSVLVPSSPYCYYPLYRCFEGPHKYQGDAFIYLDGSIYSMGGPDGNQTLKWTSVSARLYGLSSRGMFHRNTPPLIRG